MFGLVLLYVVKWRLVLIVKHNKTKTPVFYDNTEMTIGVLLCTFNNYLIQIEF